MNKKVLIAILVVVIVLLVGCCAAGGVMLFAYQRELDVQKAHDQSVIQNENNKNATQTPAPTSTVSPTATSTPTPSTSQKAIIVYMFNRELFDAPSSTDIYTPVIRYTYRSDVATFAVEQIIIGPTDQEKAVHLESTFGSGKFIVLSGSSNCSGKDFSISIVDRAATVKFCRQTTLTGDMSGSVVKDQIVKTLKQFSTVDKVRVLNYQGGCIEDLRGLTTDQCYD